MIPGPVREMLARNSNGYAKSFQAPPALMHMVNNLRNDSAGVVVLSCSDPRIKPEQILGLDSTLRATMVRNAGGRVFDSVRTLAVLQTIGSLATIVVMHHTDCGLTHFNDKMFQDALIAIAPEESDSIKHSKFGEITGLVDDSIKADVAILKASPLIKKDTNIIGLKYDDWTGKLSVVEPQGENDI